MLRDRRSNAKIKGNVYRAVVRPAPVYGAEIVGIAQGTRTEI